MLITQILGIIQFALANGLHTFFLDNIFGRFQYSPNQYDMMFGFYRSYSLYIEPSFFGWVINLSITVLLFSNKTIISKKKRIRRLIISIMALLCTLSTTAFFFLLIILFVYILSLKKVRKYVFPIMIGALIAFFCLWEFTNILAPLKRLTSINNVGSSGYERIVAPWNYVKAVMKTHPLFGRGLGQEGNVDSIGTIGKFGGVHNALFGIVVNFGLMSFIFFGIFIVNSYKKYLVNKKIVLLCFAIVAMYASTGSYLSLDTFFFLIVMLATINASATVKEKCIRNNRIFLYEKAINKKKHRYNSYLKNGGYKI